MAGKGTLTVRILGDASHLESSLGGMSKSMSDVGSKMSNIGRRMSVGMTLPIAAIGAAAVNTAMDFETSMNVLQASSGATSKQMDKMSDLAVTLGNDLTLPGASAADAGEAMTELAKAGLGVNDVMKASKGVLQLAAAGQLENADAAEITANALNAFSLSGEKATMVADQLAAVANASSAEVSDVADAFKMAAAVFSGVQGPATSAEYAMTSLNTAIAVLANQGIKGSDAGTSLKQMLLQLTGPSDKSKDAMRALYLAANDSTVSMTALTGALGKASERGDALKEMTLTASDAVKAGGDIAYDAAGKMRPLSEIIDLVAKGTANMTQEQKNAYITQIFGADASRAVIALLKAQGEETNNLREKITEGGSAAALAASKNKGLAGAIDALKSTAETFLLKAAVPLLGNLNGLIKSLSGAVEWFGNLNPRIQTVIFAGAAFLAVLGPIVGLIGTITTAIAGLSAAMAFLAANPIVLVIGAIAAVAAGLVYAYKTSETFRNIVNGVFGAVSSAVQAFASIASSTFAWVKAHLGTLSAAFTPLLFTVSLLKDHWGAVWSTITSALQGAWSVMKPIIDKVIAGVEAVRSARDFLVGGSILNDQQRDAIRNSRNKVSSAKDSPSASSTSSSTVTLRGVKPKDIFTGQQIVELLREVERTSGPLKLKIAN